MAVRKDPSLIQLYESIKTDELLNSFLRKYQLLSAPRILGYTQGRKPQPFIAYCSTLPFNARKPMCEGVITEVMKNGLPKYRCTICKSEKSAHNGPAAYDPMAPSGMTIFNGIDVLNRPNQKVSPREVLYMTFCIAYELPSARLDILIGSSFSPETLVNWGKYLRNIAIRELAQQPMMGGPGDIIEIDETYLSGKRKANRGRLMVGNRTIRGNRRNNFMGRPNGPWLFGMVCRRTKELRCSWVPNRSAATLVPIIKRSIAPGSIIYSDEWKAYNNLSTTGYHHQKVNHSTNFVDPITGASTQLIERQWRNVKLPFLRLGSGVTHSTIESHLAKIWWLSMNGYRSCSDPFLKYVDLIAKHVQL